MRAALFVLGGLATGIVALGIVFVVGMRRKSAPVLNAVRKLGRRMKPLVLRSAGNAGSPTSVVRHIGRTSGRDYQTPVVTAPTDAGFVVALPYGPNTDWLKNVLARGRASIVVDGNTYEVDQPEVVAIDDANPYFEQKEQRRHRQFNVQHALRVRAA